MKTKFESKKEKKPDIIRDIDIIYKKFYALYISIFLICKFLILNYNPQFNLKEKIPNLNDYICF